MLNHSNEPEFTNERFLERATTWIALGKSKSDFGNLSTSESELYDLLEEQILEIHRQGLGVEIVAD